MKRIISVVLVLCLLVSLGGCGKSTEDSHGDTQSEYALADFDRYNSNASENGLAGDMVYIDGVLGETLIRESKWFSHLKQSDGCEWVLIFGDTNKIDVEKIDNDFVGKKITAFGVYQGFSGTEQRPVVNMDKISLDDTVYAIVDFLNESNNEMSGSDIDSSFGNSMNESSGTITSQDFVKAFAERSEELGDIGGVISPIDVVESEDGKENNYTYNINYTYESEDIPGLINDSCPEAHMQVNVDKESDMIKRVSIFAENSALAKADGSKEQTYNLQLSLSVNLIALSIDSEVDVDDFQAKVKSATIGEIPDGVITEDFNKFSCSTNETAEFRNYIFTLK